MKINNYKKTLNDIDDKYAMLVLDFHAYVKNEGQKVVEHGIVFLDDELNPTTEETDVINIAIVSDEVVYSIVYKIDLENMKRFVDSAYVVCRCGECEPVDITDHVIEFLNSDIDYYRLLTNKQLVC